MKQITNYPRSAGKTSSVRAALSSAARLLRKAGYTWANGEWNAPARRIITIWARNRHFDMVSFRDEWARAMAADSRMPGLRLINLAEVQAESVPNLTPSAIAAAVCQRVAELDDSSSPADWPEAMLVTAEELQAILLEELAAALPVPQAKPADALDANPLTNDGDCARLEAEMAIDVCWSSSEVSAYARHHSTNQGAHETFRLHGGDKQKARRYAVTRLLSKIQMNKQA